MKNLKQKVKKEQSNWLEEESFETSEEQQRRKYSLWIVYFTTFLQNVGGSIAIIGIWPYLQQLDGDVKKEWLGWAVAAAPLGQLIFSPVIGWWCNKINCVRLPNIFCLVLFTASSLWYGVLPLHGKDAVWLLCIARFFLGISSGSITACRTYITQGTLLSERTKAMSYLSLFQGVGFILGPVGQLVLKPLGSDGLAIFEDRLVLNMYTAVGWLTAILGVTNLALFHSRFFTESGIAVREAQMMAKLAKGRESDCNENDSQVEANNGWKTLSPDYIGIFAVIFAFFTVQFNFVLIETLATPVSMDQFGWDHETAIVNVGVAMTISSVICTAIFFIVPILAKKIDECILLLIFGFLPMSFGRLFFFPYFGNFPPMKEFGCVDDKGLAQADIHTQDDCNYSWEIVQQGCPVSQSWCFDMPALNIILVTVGHSLCTLGYPFCLALSQTIFSKMIGPRPQGLWMGALTSISGLSRVIGSICITLVYTKFGTIATSGAATGLTLTSFVFLAVVHKRLVPLVPSVALTRPDDANGGKKCSKIDPAANAKL